MAALPTRPGTEIDEENAKILDARIATIEADEKESVDPEQAREEISRLRQYQTPVPR